MLYANSRIGEAAVAEKRLGRCEPGDPDLAMRKACSSLAERCLNMADEGVRFLPRLPAAVPAGRSRPPSGLFFMAVRSAGAGAVPSDPTQR